jgi:H+-transporting ATPase
MHMRTNVPRGTLKSTRGQGRRSFVHESSYGSPKAPGSKAGPSPDAKDNLQTLPLPEVKKKLRSSPDGLTQAEAKKRLAQYGPNEIEEKKTSELLKFLSYFWGPIPWMIEAAVILSAAAGHWPDFGIILVLLLANAVVGFWEEHQAGNAVAALKATFAIKARVKRDGKWVDPAARELVPGDAIRLRLGFRKGSDIRASGDLREPARSACDSRDSRHSKDGSSARGGIQCRQAQRLQLEARSERARLRL